ncbi:MAG: hypothetical protein AAGA77_10340 [Bacteroidota bacterium]
MYDDLQEKAVKNLKKKKLEQKGVYVVGMIFAAVSIILYTISLNFGGMAAYWIKFPIMVLALVYAVIYFATFGIPFMRDGDELTDEEIEREMVKIYKEQGLKNSEAENEKDELELRDIEALRNKYDDNEEYV